MNEYAVYSEVKYGEERWASFEKIIKTQHTLAKGMDFLIPGLWSVDVAKMIYDADSDEMSVYLDLKNLIGDRNDLAKLQRMFRDSGWRFLEGRWDGDFVSEASDEEAETK